MTEQELQTKRDALVSRIADAMKKVQQGDKSVEYQTITDMERALAIIDSQIATATGQSTVRTTRIAYRRWSE